MLALQITDRLARELLLEAEAQISLLAQSQLEGWLPWGPNSPLLNCPTTNIGGTPGPAAINPITEAKHPTPGTLGTDPTSRQVALREPSPGGSGLSERGQRTRLMMLFA
jgi:hypothetical protein